MVWTQFWDMHSGGGRKEGFDLCLIEAPLEEAVSIFYSRFGHSPDRVTCTCCGPDYAVSYDDSLEDLTEYHRTRSMLDKYPEGLAEFLSDERVLVIPAVDIQDHERHVDVPEQGYVWL